MGPRKWSALSESSPGRIFISYRRQETAWPAGRLYDVLVKHFAAEQVFKDVDNIEPGDDFVERITAAVASCDVLLALIGPQWLTMTDENGDRRLHNPEDYVRLEIEAALRRKIRVIPILVDEARMPRANELPPALAPLVRRNAVEINPLTFDTRRLMTAVQNTLAEVKVSDATTGSASPTPTTGPDRSDLQGAGARAPGEAEQKAKREAEERARREAEQEAKARPNAVRPAQAKAAAWRPSRRTAYFAVAVTAVLAILGILLAFFGPESPGGQGEATTAPSSTQTSTKTTAPPAPLEWQRGTDLPDPLEAAGVTVFSGAVWVVGGTAPSAGRPALDKVWFYENGWQPGPKLPVRLDSMPVTSDGKRLFVVGGQTTDSEGKNRKISREVWVLDGADDDSWEVLNRLPEERAGGALAWDGQRLVFAGGLNRRDLNGDGKAENVNHADVWAWEGEDEWREIGQLQRQREDLVAASDGNGRVWFLGGSDVHKEDSRMPLGAVDLVEEDRIKPLSDIDPVRSSAAVWLADRGVCLFGGVTRTETKNSLTTKVVCVPETASPSPTGRPLPPLTLPRAGLGGAVAKGETIWLVGGFGPEREDGPARPGLSVVEVLGL